ncbi:hypothetical protein MKW94_016586 [Papaver nudicaule]|uniref:Uncharacterized protein n=1 Tax=Papaver nudicaule TaxID=74823 RepID=A0AA42ATG8_PAPNU|nr:hypothetical protein [Papaver nudicaule]
MLMINVTVFEACGSSSRLIKLEAISINPVDWKIQKGALRPIMPRKFPYISGCKYDFVIHCASGKVIDITPGPTALMVSAFKKLTFSKKGLVPLLMSPKRENLAYLLNLVKEGKPKTIVDSKHPLSKAEDARAKSIEGHATGKIIVEP